MCTWRSTQGRSQDFSKRGGGGHTRSNNIVMAFSPQNIVGCLLKKRLRAGHLLEVGGGGWASANGEGVIPFCVPENEGLHKILQPFLRDHVFFFVHYILLSTKENITEGTNNKSNLFSK